MALINIAHPDFRRQLLDEAKKLNYIYSDQELPLGGRSIYPEEVSWSYTTHDGRDVAFRAIKSTDEEKIRELFYNLREEDIYSKLDEGVYFLSFRFDEKKE